MYVPLTFKRKPNQILKRILFKATMHLKTNQRCRNCTACKNESETAKQCSHISRREREHPSQSKACQNGLEQINQFDRKEAKRTSLGKSLQSLGTSSEKLPSSVLQKQSCATGIAWRRPSPADLNTWAVANPWISQFHGFATAHVFQGIGWPTVCLH